MNDPVKVFRETMTENLTVTYKDFKEKYLNLIVRDLSVQREEVWDALKKKGYISTAIVGSGKFTPIHICSLKDLLEVAQDQRDIAFIKRLEKFIEGGYEYAHLDGGNRCDAFLGFFAGEVKCSAGDYRFLAQYNDDGELVQENYNDYIERPMTYAELETNHPEIIKRFEQQYLILFIYKDLTSKERAGIFKMLNAGVNLNAAEERNPSQEKISTETRDVLNPKYKELAIMAGMITETKSKRFGFVELISKFATVYANKNIVPIVGGKTELDAAYQPNSIVNTEFDNFKSFFVGQFVPYLKLIVKEEMQFVSPNFFFDLFLILKNMKTRGIKLPVINADFRVKLLEEIARLQILKLAEDIQYEQKMGTKSTYIGLFSKNNDQVTRFRFKIVNEYFIPKLLDSGIVVQTDEDRLYTIEQKAQLFSKNSTTSNDQPIKPSQVFNSKKIQADHSQIPYSKGGATSIENGKLEDAEYNREKGAS